MSEITIVNNNSRMKRPGLYTEFILWSAMPEFEQRNLGIESQKAFAEYHNVEEACLSRWKKRPDFEERVDAILKVWAIGKTPTVVHGIYKAAVKGNPMSQLLWLQYFKKFNPKQEESDEKKVVLSQADIRHLIEQLPEQLKQKHYGYLRELAEDVSAWRNARDAESDNWDERPEVTVPDESSEDARDVPFEERSDEMAKGYKRSTCEDMVWPLPKSYYQGTERGWKK